MAISSDALKVPPHDLEAEKSVLGAILIDSSSISQIAQFLKPNYFYMSEHGLLFSAMLKLYEQQRTIDVVTLSDKLKEDGSLKRIGGKQYLSDLINAVPTSAY